MQKLTQKNASGNKIIKIFYFQSRSRFREEQTFKAKRTEREEPRNQEKMSQESVAKFP
jgi:hypothetical protein